MILRNETKTKFGYFPEDLSAGSHKKILISCDYCKETITKENYRLSEAKPGSKHCCKKCKVLKSHETIKKTGGMEAINKKRAATNLEKYGTLAPANNDKIQQKIQAANQIKYGTTHAIESPLVQAKIKESMMANHGVINPFELQKFQDKAKDTMKQIYGKEHFSQIHLSNSTLEKLQNKEWLFDQHITQKKCISHICRELGSEAKFQTVVNYCKRHGIEVQKYNTSIAEFEILKYLQSIGIKDIEQSNKKIIKPLEIDLYSPILKIGIDYAGLYWHSEEYKDQNYHVSKMNICSKIGIRLITIFEDEWETKKEWVKQKLKEIFIPSSENSEHITDHTSEIQSCDLRWEDGKLYEKQGYVKIKEIPPIAYWIVDSHTRICESELTENLKAQNILRIYDCGHAVYKWAKK